ncbi:ArsR/SmtB family transcription factor [Mycolicibacterium smegmatis]|uniref:ArsR/SmtB family transcription factor n=1 Tax=Mycolicibacterium smegmatis TaxID=1772 RepID=UPI0005D9CBE5|nr:SRPBCC domain-containing protein [Mycolicibacterium smegmatis]MDF1902291.1 helix-turn-helix domain-containing protein [Mycolicibacterium smegmatis]MDF1908566.1 helix-turn-helix domain-containing protein [Mycolicibacterium smegmatis]MDF1921137.1 helix-turn-helix domain-containing protein [Mycolicibacterium smegmatis]MDF1927091.1 helix-turn-helix domain-containing protein [Mycolicibacterium smegmatis]UAK55384.1 helix-turn-helix domain-containing protein [Mycolicibacterium smegmatis]
MEAVLKALSDANRRTLLARLGDRDGQTLKELCADLAMARQSVAKHLEVLEAAGLVTVQWEGRQKLHHLDTGPITELAGELTARWGAPRRHGARLEAGAGSDGDVFVYVIYIRTTPERLWHAITNPGTSLGYLGHAIESDWLKGSTYVWIERGIRFERPQQVVLESDPYQRLAFTYPMPRTPDLDDPGAEHDTTRVSFDIEPGEHQVKLTLVHDGLRPDSITHTLVSGEWPLKLSDLKSGLEQLTAP